MDLPDPEAIKPKEPELNDANTMFAFQEHVNKITNTEDEKPPPDEDEPKPAPQPMSITSIAVQMA